MPVLAYCVVQQNGHFLTAHPEFSLVTAEGQRRGRFCYNSGYLEVLKQITAEQLAYGIDGFHMDMLDQGFNPPYGCWCNSCQKKFRDIYGRAMPKGVTWDEDWDRMLEFRYRSSETFEKELYRHIKSINPRASVDYNYHGNTPFSFEVGQRPVQHSGNGDFVTGETGVWGFSALTVGLNAEFYRASTPGLPFQVAVQRGVRMYHDQTTRPLNDLRWEMFTLLAHGAFFTVVDKTGFDGGLDFAAYDRLGTLFREVQTRRGQFGQTPVREVGIYFSSRTRDWHGREWSGDTIRFAMLGTHYRQPIDWTLRGLETAEAVLEDLVRFAGPEVAPDPTVEVVEAISDDLNTPQVISALHALRNRIVDPGKGEVAAQLGGNLAFLGISERRFHHGELVRARLVNGDLGSPVYGHIADVVAPIDSKASGTMKPWPASGAWAHGS